MRELWRDFQRYRTQLQCALLSGRTMNNCHMPVVAQALLFHIIYTTSPILYITTTLTTLAIPWFLLGSISSTVFFSLLAAHLLNNPSIILFQFFYWLISWGWLVWKVSSCVSFHGILMIQVTLILCCLQPSQLSSHSATPPHSLST